MKEMFATLVSARSAVKTEDYFDGRKRYIGKSGLLQITEGNDEDSYKMKFSIVDNTGHVSFISTSSGKLIRTDHFISIRTGRSLYIFSGKVTLTDEEKGILQNAD